MTGEIAPRLITKLQAAAYLTTSPRNYDRLRKAGKVPGFVEGMARIDRIKLDEAIDELSKTARKTAQAAEVDPLAKWRKDARQSRKRPN